MLKAMLREFESLLNDNDKGVTFGLFDEFNTQPWRIPELREKFDNLGVLYIDNGDLNSLPDGALMNISYTLDLFMKVKETYNSSAPVVLPLQNLATGVTGVIYPESGGTAEYFLDVGLPSGDGALIEGGDCNYIHYQLPVTVVFTKGVSLNDNKGIIVTIGDTSGELKGVLSFTEAPQTQLETSVFVNAYGQMPAMQNETMIVSTGWNAQISKLFYPDDAVDAALYALTTSNPRQKFTVTYNGVQHTVIAHDCVLAHELGQVTYWTINLSTAMRSV